MSKLPDPVAYLTDAPEHKFISFFLSRDPHSKQESLYSETQVKELLAQADKQKARDFMAVHKQMVDKYEPVLKMALEAMTARGPDWVVKEREAIKAIQEVLS